MISLCTNHLYGCIDITIGAPLEVKENIELGQQRERNYHPLLNKSYAVMDKPAFPLHHHQVALQSSAMFISFSCPYHLQSLSTEAAIRLTLETPRVNP